MKNKLLGILLMIIFSAVIVQPLVPFVQYYFIQKEQVANYSIEKDCSCNCSDSVLKKTKMASNGDAYLKALIKRVCNDQKKQAPKLSVVSISVFVTQLFDNAPPIYVCPEKNYNKISNFIIQPSLSSFIQEHFRPPQTA